MTIEEEKEEIKKKNSLCSLPMRFSFRSVRFLNFLRTNTKRKRQTKQTKFKSVILIRKI
jgi:hypothetical protein